MVITTRSSPHSWLITGFVTKVTQTSGTQERIQGGWAAHPVPPLKLEKKKICWRKIVIFHTKYTKMFAPPSARRIFSKCSRLTWNPGSTPGTSGAWTAYLSGTSEFTSGFNVVFCVVFCRSLIVLLLIFYWSLHSLPVWNFQTFLTLNVK